MGRAHCGGELLPLHVMTFQHLSDAIVHEGFNLLVCIIMCWAVMGALLDARLYKAHAFCNNWLFKKDTQSVLPIAS